MVLDLHHHQAEQIPNECSQYEKHLQMNAYLFKPKISPHTPATHVSPRMTTRSSIKSHYYASVTRGKLHKLDAWIVMQGVAHSMDAKTNEGHNTP